MSTFERKLIRLMEQTHPLDQVARAGYVLRGVANPESVAAHSHGVSLLVLFMVDAYPDVFDRDKALTMALLHDLPEALMMDIPMPAANAYFKDAKNNAEIACFDDLFVDFPERYRALFRELQAGQSREARLVRGLDKAQMMMRIMSYQRESRGCLDEFWENPANFNDYGIAEVSRVFDAICNVAGRTRPAPKTE